MSNAQLRNNFHEFLKSDEGLKLNQDRFEFYMICLEDFKNYARKQVRKSLSRRSTLIGLIKEQTAENNAHLYNIAKVIYKKYFVSFSPNYLQFTDRKSVNKIKEIIYCTKTPRFDMFDQLMDEFYLELESKTFPKYLQSGIWYNLARQQRPIAYEIRKCSECSVIIHPHQPHLSDDDNKIYYHWDCVKCHKCGIALQSKSCCLIEGRNVSCGYCDNNDFFIFCRACNKVIIDESIEVDDLQWHTTCYACIVCKVTFPKNEVHEKMKLINHFPVCELHTKDFNEIRFKCGADQRCKYLLPEAASDEQSDDAIRPPETQLLSSLSSEEVVHALGADWHSECFCCTICEKNLSTHTESANYNEIDGKIQCFQCTDIMRQKLDMEMKKIQDEISNLNFDTAEYKQEQEKEKEELAQLETGQEESPIDFDYLENLIENLKNGEEVIDIRGLHAEPEPTPEPEPEPVKAPEPEPIPEPEPASVDPEPQEPIVEEPEPEPEPIEEVPIIEEPAPEPEPEPEPEPVEPEVVLNHCSFCKKEILSEDDYSEIVIDDKKLHKHCVTCSICSKVIEKSSQILSQDNFNIVCDDHPDRVCVSCCNIIGAVESFVISSRVHGERKCHVNCFHCKCCSADLDGKKFELGVWEDKISLLCYYHTSKCPVCTLNFAEEPVESHGQYWHKECCSCAICAKDLALVENVVISDGKYICFEHSVATCSLGCGRLIQPGEPALQKDNRKFHEGCFICKTCNAKLDNTGSYVWSHDEESDFLEVRCSKHCQTCSQGIHGPYLRVGDFNFHSDCFVCYGCQQPIEGSFVMKDDQFYCEKCIE